MSLTMLASARTRLAVGLVLALAGCATPTGLAPASSGLASAASGAIAAATSSTDAPPTRPALGAHLDAEPRRRLLIGIHRAADYLARACDERGHFVYRVHLDASVELDEEYNILRHAGAIYAMASHEARWPDATMRRAIARATEHLRHEYIAELPDAPELSAVWSKPTRRGLREAKLGGAGLALVALAAPPVWEPQRRDDLAALAGFVLFMQKPDGSFFSKFFPDGVGRDDRWTSLYYPGEAALGLIEAHRHTRAPEQRRAAERALRFLAQSRRGQRGVPPDHWALLATRALFASGTEGYDRDLLLEHGIQIAQTMLDDRHPHRDDSPRRGSFSRDGRTTPTATRLEGLLALHGLLDRDEQRALRERIASAAAAGIEFLLRAQVDAGEFRGAIPQAYPAADPRGEANEVRIDYVQHALSAFIQYLELEASR